MSDGEPDIKQSSSGKAILPAFQALVITGEIAFLCLVAGSYFPYFEQQLMMQLLQACGIEDMRGAQLPRITDVFVKFGTVVGSYPMITFVALVALGVALWVFLKKIHKPKNPFAEALLLLGSSFFLTMLAFGAMVTAIIVPISQTLPCARCVTLEEAVEAVQQQQQQQNEQPTS